MGKEKNVNWNVSFGSGYWGKETTAGCEIAVNRQFQWNDKAWYVPAIYLFEEGIVIDYCIKVDPAKVKAWIDKWQIGSLNEHEITHEQWAQMEQENPLAFKFNSKVTVNGAVLAPKTGSSISWIPKEYLPGDLENVEEAAQVLQYYGLDEKMAWSFHRWTYSWAETKQKEIQSLRLKLERGLEEIQGIQFENPSVGDKISFVHPISGIEHKLTVLEYEPNEISLRGDIEEEYEFPKYHTAMKYVLEPDLSECSFQVKDCLKNDAPKSKGKAQDGASSIGIIGGADGPTALAFSKEGTIRPHMALSALHFKPVEHVTWKIVFREKLVEDIDVDLFT